MACSMLIAMTHIPDLSAHNKVPVFANTMQTRVQFRIIVGNLKYILQLGIHINLCSESPFRQLFSVLKRVSV